MNGSDCSQGMLLSAYLDGELAGEEAARFEQHLRECSHCSSPCAAFQRNDLLLKQSIPSLLPPPHLKTDILRAIQNTEERRGILAGLRLSLTSNLKSWAYACAPILLFAIAFSAFHLQQRMQNGKLLAQIDHSRTEWIARDKTANPFNIDSNGAPLRVTGNNPFEAYLNVR
jgi:anti-sigma factor RsiW